MQHTPLFPTSFRDFCFAHGAHGATVRASMEAARCVRDMLPRILGTTRPEGEAWSFANLQPPTVVVERRNVAQVSSPTGRSSFVHRRMALAVLYLVPRIEAEVAEEVVRDDAADPLTEAMHLQRFLLPQHRHKFDVALWASALTSWNVAVQDHVGWTLLHHAVFHDHSSAATEILAKCDVDVRSRGGETALHIAVQRHHINMVKLLCGRGANPLAQNHRRNSPLHLSLIHRRAEMVDLLMTNVAACDGWREAVTDCINAEHQSPIHLFQELSPSLLDLCYDGSEDAMSAIDTLVHHPLFLTNATSAARQNDDDDDDDDVANEDALHFAAAYGGSASVMRYLYSRSEYHPSSSRTPLNELKQTPLHIAAGRGHLDCVKIIATTSPQQLMCRDRNGATPLLEALRRRRYAVAEWLLSEEVVRDGASHTDVCVGAVDHLGNAALHYACGAGHIKLVKVLVERHHADVRLKCGVECSTCLPFVSAERYASRRQHEHDDDEMMMMTHGCFTPLRCATRARPFREELVAYLCNNGGVVGEEEARDALDALITHGFFHLAEEVLANLPHEMASALEDNSLLLRFCSRKNSAAIAWCIAHRLATLHTTMGGDPVRASAAVGDEWAINFLVEAGASANAGSSRQDSALCEAIVRNQHAAVGALMRHGARLSGDDFSALSVAVELLHDDIITGLLGAQTVEPADVAQSLVELLSRPYACADRCGRRGHNRHQRTRRVARRLARHYDASQSLHVVHPTMLLHLAASTSMFEVVEELLDGLARLPEITRAEVLMGGVAAPVKVPRPPLAQRQHRRHQQHPEKKDEHVVVLRPIKERRDAYSYCAAHNQLLIAHRLWREAGVVPWEVADNSGHSCTDYAMERGDVEMLQLLCTLGIFPRRVSRGKRGPLMEALQAAGGIPLTVRRACATEVVAMLIAQQHPPLLIQSMLRCITDGAPEMMSVSTADVESWVLVCVRAKRIDALRIIRTWWEDSQAMRFASEALDRLGCLMAAVDVGDCEMARYLLELQCSPNALAPMPISCYVQHRVGWKLGKEECATPLCLAAWRQDARMLALLANAAPVDGPSYMDREKVRRDAIKALIVAPNPTLCASIRDAQTANLIRTFARHGHPLSSSASVREAAARGWCATVRALLDCYGAEPSFIHFLLERGTSHVLPAAYYMAVNPTMFGWLRDMLVATDDAHGLLHLTDLAMHLMKQVQPRPTILDYAMQHGHDEAAIFFMAHGFPSHHTFFKVSSRRSSRSTLGPLLRLTLAATQKHMIKAAGVPAATRYLQAAMLLGFGEVVHRLVGAVEGFSTSASDVMVPTLLPMALSHAHGWDQFACVLQRHPLLQLPTLQPSDMFCIISCLGLCPSLITMCSRVEVRSALKETTSIWLVDGHEVWRRRSSLMPRRTSMLLTRGASLAWAIALGKEEWVRYLVSLEPQLLHGCTASLAKVPGNMAWGPANIFPYGVELNGFRGHEAEEIAVSDCEESSVDVCVLAMLMLAECRHEKTGRHLRQRAIMLQLLQQIMAASACSWSSATLNVLAIAAAKMAEWDVLAAIMRVADATLAKDEAHYFRSVDEEEVPPAMAGVVQDCRHVMQAVAAAGSCDVVMEVFERSKREDVEQAGDAKHRTAVYWAMVHPRATTVKVFLQLQVNLELSCCRSHHRTPLMMACRRGRTQVVLMMLKAHVPLALNAQDKEGCTALMCAAERGCGRLVKELLAAKADASLLNASGMSAAMLAALGGHDELAQLLMDVPHAAPLEGATTTMLHAAAVGGCWLTAEKAIQRFRGASLMLKKDASGATALTVAHAFGSTRVLHIMKAALPADAFTPFRCHDFLEACQPAQVAPRRKKLRWSATAKMPKTEFGWFRAIMTLNAALARCETSPDELQQQQQQQHELRSHVPASTDLLTWCVEADDVVGMRVLGEMGVMDEDGAALLAAAKLGRTSIAEVLLLHHMSPSNVADHHGLPPYAVAALHRHPNTARMMLLHTQEAHLVPRTEVNTDVAEAARERLNTSSSAAHDAGSNGGTTTEGDGVFSFAHVLASSCNGELLELLCQRLTPGSMSSARLLQQLQKPAENGLMAMEYAAAVGGPSALIRTARALQQLSQAHVDPSRPTKAGEGKLLPASASITTFLLAESSFLSPAVRVLLLEVFGVALALDLAPRPLTRDNRRRRGRLTMADVRLIGTNALERTDDCVAIMRHFMTVAREEAALRQTLPDYGSCVCLDLSALESCTAMQKRALLQWMGTSVMREVVGACCPRRGVRRAEKVVVVATTRGVGGATTFRPHGGVVSLLVHIPPSNSYLVMPTIQWPAVLQERRTKRMQEVQALCDEATALLQAMPFPPFQAAVVDVEWSRPITHTDEEPLFDGTCDRLVAAVKDVRDYFRHELHAMVENEANMDAVKAFWQRQYPAGGRRTAAGVRFLHVEDAHAFVPAEVDAPQGSTMGTIAFGHDGVPGWRGALQRSLERCLQSSLHRYHIQAEVDAFCLGLEEVLHRHDVASTNTRQYPTTITNEESVELPALHRLLTELKSAVVWLLGLQQGRLWSKTSDGRMFGRGEAWGCGLPTLRTIIARTLPTLLRDVRVEVGKVEDRVEVNANGLTLCGGAISTLGRDEMIAILSAAAVRAETEKLRMELPSIMASCQRRWKEAMGTSVRLQMQGLEMPNLAEDAPPCDHEEVLAAFTLLTSHESAKVLHPLVDGLVELDGSTAGLFREVVEEVSVHWDAHCCSAYCNMHVEPKPDAGLAIQLSIYYPLQCAEMGSLGWSRLQLLSKTQVRYLVMAHLASVPAVVAKMAGSLDTATLKAIRHVCSGRLHPPPVHQHWQRDSVATPTTHEEPPATPTTHEEPLATPTIHEEPLATPTIHEEPLATPTTHEEPPAAAAEVA